MSNLASNAGPIVLALVFGLGLAGCNGTGREDAGPAPVDSGVQTGTADTAATTTATDTLDAPATPDTLGVPTTPDTLAPPEADTGAARRPDTSVATPPITPPPTPAPRDSPSEGAAKPAEPSAQPGQGGSLKVTPLEYEGWRQYSVNCARCHGQDVLPNPVVTNLLVTAGPGGPMEDPKAFFQVVSEGRPERGMPPFKSILSPEQINAIYAYVKGRAEGRIPPGRPDRPQA